MRPILCTIAAVGLALAGPLAAQELRTDAPRQITVSGSAEIEATPDLAMVTAGVETQAADAAAALAANSEAMAAVFKALEAAKIDKRDMQTSQLNLSPVYDPQQNGSEAAPKVVAYQASNLVTVRVRDVAALGAVIDDLTGAGANRLYGVSFEVADPRPVLDTARRQAVADAKTKAQLFTEAAGVTLGPVISIREGGGGGSPAPFRAKADMAAAPPVAAGSVTLSADVEVVFGIE